MPIKKSSSWVLKIIKRKEFCWDTLMAVLKLGYMAGPSPMARYEI